MLLNKLKPGSLIILTLFFLITLNSSYAKNTQTKTLDSKTKTQPTDSNESMKVSLNPKNWKELKFSKLKANKVSGNEAELIIAVDSSSSPLIHKLDSIKKFSKVLVEGQIYEGKLNMDGKKQGVFKHKKSETDDYVLRFGLVLKGKNKKPPVPGFLIASWIKEMFKLAPKGTGVDKIHFLKVVHNPKDIGELRTHPLSKYLFEEAITSAQTGEFKIEKTFKNLKELLGFWISANGEGTQSKFKIKITKIEIK